MGHLRLTIGYLKATVVHIRVTLGHLRVTIALVKILDALRKHSTHLSVALLGEYGVGKTALLQAALRNIKNKGIKVSQYTNIL